MSKVPCDEGLSGLFFSRLMGIYKTIQEPFPIPSIMMHIASRIRNTIQWDWFIYQRIGVGSIHNLDECNSDWLKDRSFEQLFVIFAVLFICSFFSGFWASPLNFRYFGIYLSNLVVFNLHLEDVTLLLMIMLNTCLTSFCLHVWPNGWCKRTKH